MHAYDVPARQSYAPLPSGRAAQDSAQATPIYDALYAEYVASFRAFPGDRSDEEELGFTAFSRSPHDRGPYGARTYGSGHSVPQHATGPLGSPHGHPGPASSVWQQVARHARGMHHVPALPPAPRQGL
ncbi:hypothetical protein AB0L85_29005 [Streptomyces sp. NPDC052051]|uniref:hypothetical protein n=1 Tax=Streptomyces sp. NPDC052051 TaxID=3154649 RepID=UPI00342F54DC